MILAVKQWAHLWCNKDVLVHTDNTAVKAFINRLFKKCIIISTAFFDKWHGCVQTITSD